MTFVRLKMSFHEILIIALASNVLCIWPPEIKVNLKYQEEFEISETLEQSDVQDIYDEEELIQEEDFKTLNLFKKGNINKYFRLHGMANRINSNIKSINENDENYLKRLVAKVDFLHKYPEFNPDVEESKPFVAGFVNANNDIIKDEDTIYFGDSGRKSGPIIQKVEKRRSAESNITDYDYDKLKKEYEDSLQKAENKKDAAKYKEVKEDESPQEAVQTLVEFKAKNCTEEEKTGLGVAAIRCFLTESQQKHLNKDQKFYMAKKVLLIALIWIIVYILIAVPLWCQYGWCCCCCRCKFCHPRELIEEVKTFYENNPAGVYVDDSGNIKKYKPSTYEIYAEKNLKKAIDRL